MLLRRRSVILNHKNVFNIFNVMFTYEYISSNPHYYNKDTHFSHCSDGNETKSHQNIHVHLDMKQIYHLDSLFLIFLIIEILNFTSVKKNENFLLI